MSVPQSTFRFDAGAEISPCRRFRYHLWRTFPTGYGSLAFVMLNPSTADGETDDPTIRKCIGFAKRMGRQRIDVVNLFAYRATYPRELRKQTEIVGPDNDAWIRRIALGADRVICAWGRIDKALEWRPQRVRALLNELGVDPLCLGLTNGGQPRHPLMLAYETALVDLRGQEVARCV